MSEGRSALLPCPTNAGTIVPVDLIYEHGEEGIRTVETLRRYGTAPYTIVVIHGGPGAGGEMAPVARELAPGWGVLEPIQTATTIEGQVQELRGVLERAADLPATLVGYSWGAWLGYLVAARYPALVRKLILVGSGPFEARYTAGLREARLSRLGEDERAEFAALLEALSDPGTADVDRALARLGALARQTDTYDPLPDDPDEEAPITPDGERYQRVWDAAAAMRASGALLALAHQIRCPVVAIHGDYDPHPAAGVREPLAAIVQDFKFVLIERCGHQPWIERQARDAFYETLREVLEGAGHLGGIPSNSQYAAE
jgi:pimeloyl-ACP methyl ester carboxylesterase